MPRKSAIKKARVDRRKGKAPSTQAGEFVHEEMEHVREGKQGARSTKQAIAIGLSKARRAGVRLRAPRKGPASARTRSFARHALARGRKHARTSQTRSRAISKALRREGHRAASHRALSRQAHSASRRRSAAARSRSARKAAQTRKHK